MFDPSDLEPSAPASLRVMIRGATEIAPVWGPAFGTLPGDLAGPYTRTFARWLREAMAWDSRMYSAIRAFDRAAVIHACFEAWARRPNLPAVGFWGSDRCGFLPSGAAIPEALAYEDGFRLATGRQAARHSGDWPLADALRARLTRWGYEILDLAGGTLFLQTHETIAKRKG